MPKWPCWATVTSKWQWRSIWISSKMQLRWDWANNCALPVVDSYKDLDTTYDMHLSYTLHVQNITARASQRAKLILTRFTTRNPDVLMKTFIVYVRPMLEFSSTVWNPMTKQNICKVESVQKRFTKRLVGLSKISYNTRDAQHWEFGRKTSTIWSYYVL